MLETLKINQKFFTIHTQSYIRAQNVYQAALVCQFKNPQIHIDDNFQWELDKFITGYRVTFFGPASIDYGDLAKELASCMKQLKN